MSQPQAPSPFPGMSAPAMDADALVTALNAIEDVGPPAAFLVHENMRYGYAVGWPALPSHGRWAGYVTPWFTTRAELDAYVASEGPRIVAEWAANVAADHAENVRIAAREAEWLRARGKPSGAAPQRQANLFGEAA